MYNLPFSVRMVIDNCSYIIHSTEFVSNELFMKSDDVSIKCSVIL